MLHTKGRTSLTNAVILQIVSSQEHSEVFLVYTVI